VLNDDDEESESTQSKAGQGDLDVDIGDPDTAPAAPRNLARRPVGDGFDLTALLHSSNFTAADISNADGDNSFDAVTNDEGSGPSPK
jgi:hypothetical protein